MKNDEKKLLYLSTVFISIFAIFIFLVGYNIELLPTEKLTKYTIILIFIMSTILISYYISSYFLGKSLKINQHLSILLKDTLHELNIPLSVIKANIQMLKNGENDEKKLKKLKRVEKASEELYGLYKDVDYYIKKEARHEVREFFELKRVINDEVEKFKILYPSVDINVDVSSLNLYADKRGFARVIDNLLENALKYNRDSNEISIYLRYNELVIRDRGVGMSESDLFLIFDRYYQAEKRQNGFGIGLSIVKAFCDENGIFIKIDSKVGIGTEISLDIKSLKE